MINQRDISENFDNYCTVAKGVDMFVNAVEFGKRAYKGTDALAVGGAIARFSWGLDTSECERYGLLISVLDDRMNELEMKHRKERTGVLA